MIDNLYDRDRAAIGSLQKLRFFRQSAVGGSRSHLRNADGRALLDMSASWGAASLGYSHPALIDAVLAAISDQAGASVLSGANAAISTSSCHHGSETGFVMQAQALAQSRRSNSPRPACARHGRLSLRCARTFEMGTRGQ